MDKIQWILLVITWTLLATGFIISNKSNKKGIDNNKPLFMYVISMIIGFINMMI